MANDVLVVGSGMAGLTAAIAAASRGKRVRLASLGAGALTISGGCIDVLGYVAGKTINGSPFAAISELPPEHPYSLIGVENVQKAISFFAGICKHNGFPLMYSEHENTWIPTILGTFKPTYMCTTPFDRSLLTEAKSIMFVGFKGLKDCQASLTTLMLQKHKRLTNKEIISIELAPPFGKKHRSLTQLDIARFVDTPEGVEWLYTQLTPHVAKERVFMLPPVLGIRTTQVIYQTLAIKLGCPIIEMLTPPPGVGGLRLHHALFKALYGLGITLLENVHVTGAHIEGNRCTNLITTAPDRKRELAADSFIIATGGLFGGGVVTTPFGVKESIFDIPLAAPDNVEHWSNPDVFTSQPYSLFGVKVNNRLNPINDSGDVFWENVYFAGRTLASYDFITEKSGNGVAIASGYHAAQQC